MIYYLYKITNTVNGRFYIGVHKTENIDDGYMGSGKLLKRAIRKHGIELFNKEILKFFSSEEDMFKEEALIVTEEFIRENRPYNMAPGGSGGTISKNRKPFNRPHSEETKKKLSVASTGKHHSEETRKKMRENHFSRKDPTKHRENAIRSGKIGIEKRQNRAVDESIRKKISETMLRKNRERVGPYPTKGIPRKRVTCPHCGVIGANNVMTRFHFDKCKYKISSSGVTDVHKSL